MNGVSYTNQSLGFKEEKSPSDSCRFVTRA
jgi:hypothetical protein